jgi:hypothetical protein
VTATKACFHCGATGLAVGVTERSHRLVEVCRSCSGWTFSVLTSEDAASFLACRTLVVDQGKAA